MKDESLPQNWFYKGKHASESRNDVQYCSPDGILLDTKEKLSKYVQHQKDMSNDDLMKLKRLRRNGKASLDDKSWTRGDPTVPTGWGFKEFNLGSKKTIRLISPEGKIYNSKRSALKALTDEKYPAEEIEEI